MSKSQVSLHFADKSTFKNYPLSTYTQPERLSVINSVQLYVRSLRGSDGRCVQEPGTYSLRPDETQIRDIPRLWKIITSINPHHDSGSKDSPSPSAQAAKSYRKKSENPFPFAEARWLSQCSARAAQNI